MFPSLAPRPILETLVHKYNDYVEPVPLRVAMGTYNINGGKHFRSIVYKDVSLSDWLLDAHKTVKGSSEYNLEVYGLKNLPNLFLSSARHFLFSFTNAA